MWDDDYEVDYNDEAEFADLYGEDDWYEEDSALWG